VPWLALLPDFFLPSSDAGFSGAGTTGGNKCPKGCNALAIVNALNSLGYLYPPENEISVSDILMSKRLQNVLVYNNILYLSQLSIHSREEILGFRNMGKAQ